MLYELRDQFSTMIIQNWVIILLLATLVGFRVREEFGGRIKDRLLDSLSQLQGELQRRRPPPSRRPNPFPDEDADVPPPPPAGPPQF